MDVIVIKSVGTVSETVELKNIKGNFESPLNIVEFIYDIFKGVWADHSAPENGVDNG